MDSFNFGQTIRPLVSQFQTQTQTPTTAPVTSTGAPTWNSVYQNWLTNEYKPKFGNADINRDWNRDDDARNQKLALDQTYLNQLAEYNKTNGTNIGPESQYLGVTAQPNTFTETDHSNDGFFGGAAKSLGMSTKDFGTLAALAAGGYGLYSMGAFGGAGTTLGAGGTTSGLSLSAPAASSFVAPEALSGVAAAPELAASGLSTISTTPTVAGGFEALTGVPAASTLGTTGLSTIANPAYSLAGGSGTLGSASLAGTTAGMAGPGMTLGGSGTAAAGMGGGTGLTLGGVGAGAGGTTLSSIVKGAGNLSNIVKAGSSLYSAIKGGQTADNTNNIINSQMQTLQDMYKEGSPWANQLKAQLAAKDAAAGRNSQYGPREAQFQALLADKAGQNAGVLAQLAQQSGNANANSNMYTNLALNRLGDVANATGLTKWAEGKLSNTASDVGNYLSSAWDSYFGG